MNILEGARHTQIRHLNAYHVEGNLIQQSIPPEVVTLFDLLQPIIDASHMRDRKRAPPDSACLPGTRTGLIQVIISWAFSSLLLRWQHVLWLYGYAGSGKSAIAQAICEQAQEAMLLLASFFFFQNAGDRGKIGKLPNTLASQLARTIPETVPLITAAVKAEPNLLQAESTLSLSARLHRLVYDPFKAVVERSLFARWSLCRPYLIVIDGLDECEDKEGAQEFIDCTLKFFDQNPYIPLRVFISSRVEQHIQPRLKVAGVQLLDLSDHSSTDDVEAFLEIAFKDAIKASPVVQAYIRDNGEWPTRSDFHDLKHHIGGSFIFASTLFKFVFWPNGKDDHSTPMDRLPLALGMHPGLDGLYSKTLQRSEHRPHFSIIISTIARLMNPLPIPELASLLEIRPHEVVVVLMDLQAILQIPGTDEAPVTVCHRSLVDFLTTKRRSGRFFVPPSFHARLFAYCHRRMMTVARRAREVRLDPDVRQGEMSSIFYSFKYGNFHYRLGARYIDVGDELPVQLGRHTAQQHHNQTRLQALNSLGLSLQNLFAYSGCIAHILKAIETHREALALPTTNGTLGALISASHLGNALQALYDHGGMPLESAKNCIDTAVSLHRGLSQVFLLRNDQHPYTNSLPSQCESLNNVANALCSMKCGAFGLAQSLGDEGGGGHDHEEIERLCRQSLNLAGPSGKTRFCPLMNLGIVSYCRFKQSGSAADLKEGISLLRQALSIEITTIFRFDTADEDPLNHAKALKYLVVCLQSLYEIEGNIGHLDAAIKSARDVLLWHYTAGHSGHREWKEKLIHLLQIHFDVTGNKGDLDRIAKLKDEDEEVE